MHTGQRFKRIAALMSALLVGACSTPYKSPQFASHPDGETAFPGIAQWVSTSTNKSIDVLMVHGMCTHDERWARQSIVNLNNKLGGTAEPEIAPREVAGTDITRYQALLTLPFGTVWTNALVWSPVVAPLKNQLCYDQTDKSDACTKPGVHAPPYPYTRASLNRALKDKLLDDCLADAVIYQGKSRDEINAQMQKAIIAAAGSSAGSARSAPSLAAAASAGAPLVIITESLGSKITFDAILKLTQSASAMDAAAGINTFDRTVEIFMAANQLPLLSLADQSLNGTPSVRAIGVDYATDALAALMNVQRVRSSGMSAGLPRVVAFTDPNDILSFILVPAHQTAPYAVVDVIVSNQKTYLGAFENPNDAHTSYLLNPTVTRLIACGNEQPLCDAK